MGLWSLERRSFSAFFRRQGVYRMFERHRDRKAQELSTADTSVTKKKPQRPATLTRKLDQVLFVRRPGGWYEVAGRKEHISIVEAARIIEEDDPAYTISDQEAPDPYTPPKPAFVLHRGGLPPRHPLIGDKNDRHR